MVKNTKLFCVCVCVRVCGCVCVLVSIDEYCERCCRLTYYYSNLAMTIRSPDDVNKLCKYLFKLL